MQMTADRIPDENLVSSMPFDSSLEAMEAFGELERRRALVASGKSKILDESEAFDALKAAGCHV